MPATSVGMPWDFGGLSKQWELGPGPKNEAVTAALVPFDSLWPQLGAAAVSTHPRLLGLIFTWALLRLGFLPGAAGATGLKASGLCSGRALLENKERAVRLGVHTYNLPIWVHFPDTKRVEWLNKMEKHMWPLFVNL